MWVYYSFALAYLHLHLPTPSDCTNSWTCQRQWWCTSTCPSLPLPLPSGTLLPLPRTRRGCSASFATLTRWSAEIFPLRPPPGPVTLQDLYPSRTLGHAGKIGTNPSHHKHKPFETLPSSRRPIRTKTSQHKNSFCSITFDIDIFFYICLLTCSFFFHTYLYFLILCLLLYAPIYQDRFLVCETYVALNLILTCPYCRK